MRRTNSPASTKDGFLSFPKMEYCTTCLSLGTPGAGKTYVFLKCVEYWVANNTFSEYHIVLPSYKNEMNDSYAWLEPIKNVYVYEKYFDKIGEDIIAKQKKNRELFTKGKIKEIPRIFFAIDDATSQGKLFKSESVKALVTQNRHLYVHSFFLMHADKGVIEPKIRQNIFFVFIYKVKDNFLQHIYKEYVNFSIDFDTYTKDFKPFFREYVSQKQYGCLLLGGSRDYSPFVDEWFTDETNEQ
jgi:hypothetical protein